MLSRITYAALCVLVPLVWGILVARVFDWMDRRFRKPEHAAREAAPEIEYYI